jgi:hypothetical protein
MEFKLHEDYERWDKQDESGNKYGKVPAISWFTNLPHNKRNEKIILYKEYNELDYPMYDNYFAWNVDKVKDIPVNKEIEIILTEEQYQQLLKSGQEFELIEVIEDEK